MNSQPHAFGRWPANEEAPSLRLLAYRLDINRDAHLVANYDTALIKGRIPTDPVVVTVDGRRGDKAGPDHRTFIDTLLPVGRLPLAKILEIQRYRPRHTTNGELPLYPVLMLTKNLRSEEHTSE